MWLDFHLRDFLFLFIVVLAHIVVGDCLSVNNWYVVISLGNIICVPTAGAGVGEVYFAEFPLSNFIVFFVIVIVALIVIGNLLLGRGD